jgi:hypothetical protein
VADHEASRGPMGTAQSYLELHRGLKFALLCTCFAIASVSLFLGVGMYLFLPGGVHYGLFDRIFPFSFLLLAVIIDIGIARVMYPQRQRSFLSLFGVVLAATVVGAIIVSMVIVREHWVELVKESLRFG